MGRLFADFDLHVIGIAIWPLMLALVLPAAWSMWTIALLALVPQGRIWTRASDLRASGKPVRRQVVSSELVVTLFVLIAVGINALRMP